MMTSKERNYHDLLEEALILLRTYINKHINEMDDIDVYNIGRLIRDIEQTI